jgi:hypothetical protein
MLEVTRLDIPQMLRHASEDPLLPNPKNRKVAAAVVLILSTALCVVSFELFDTQGPQQRNSTFGYCITYVLVSHMVLSCLINERMDTQLNFVRKLRVKNII